MSENWIKDTMEKGNKELLAKQQEISGFYEKVLLKIILADTKILIDQYIKKMSGCLTELRKS